MEMRTRRWYPRNDNTGWGDWEPWSEWAKGLASVSVIDLLINNPDLDTVTLTWNNDTEIQWRRGAE